MIGRAIRRLSLLGALLASGLAAAPAHERTIVNSSPASASLEIRFFDVGQGDAILIRVGSSALL
ncbi:MAG TPA: hypothetical protein VHV78_01275, partial [Gemmatimonadaceae bacterium]|nr:hypothetical protein [Gemmatimonadaceae bacterium]